MLDHNECHMLQKQLSIYRYTYQICVERGHRDFRIHTLCKDAGQQTFQNAYHIHTTSRKKDLMHKTDNLRSIRYHSIYMERRGRRGFVILK